MGKRGNNEGSISKRKDGRWYGRYTVQTPDGPKQRSVYGRTREEVAEKLADAISDSNKGLVFDATTTLNEYLDSWVVDVKDTGIRQRTWERYEQVVRLHLKPALGRVKLKNLTPNHVRGLYRDKLQPPRNGRPLSPRSVQYIHTTLHKALKQAVHDGLIPRNVCEAVKSPKPSKQEMHPLSSEQAKVFLDTARGERLEALYVLAIHTGLRQGELLGLKWEDLDNGYLYVQRSLSHGKFNAPKTAKSRRRVKLSQRAINALRSHRVRQNEEKRLAASSWGILGPETEGLMFPNRSGEPMHPWILTTDFTRLLKRAELPLVRFHDLRHTCATLLFKAGQHPKTVQELLGHSSISITLDTYSHVLPGMGDGLADAMDDTLG